MSLEWRSISVADPDDPTQLLFQGYFSVNPNKQVVGFYETVDGQTDFTHNLLTSQPLPPEGVSPNLGAPTNLFDQGAFVGATNIVSEHMRAKLAASGVSNVRSGFQFQTSTTLATVDEVDAVVVDLSGKADVANPAFTGTGMTLTPSGDGAFVIALNDTDASAELRVSAPNVTLDAQEVHVPNMPPSTSDTTAASTAFVSGAVSAATSGLLTEQTADAKYGQLAASNTWSGDTNTFSGAVSVARLDFAGTGVQIATEAASQGTNAIAIGNSAGNTSQGASAIAIGASAGTLNQHANSIILNASGTAFQSDGASRCYINPVRNAASANMLEYNPITSEITHAYVNTAAATPLLNPLSEGVDLVNSANWTLRSNGTTGLARVTWAPQLRLFIASRATGPNDQRVMTSPDGITWTAQTTPLFVRGSGFNGGGIAWSDTLGRCVIASGSDQGVLVSSDGVTWTNYPVNPPFGLNAVAWSAELGLFVAVGTNTIQTSPDGQTWTQQSTATRTWLAVSWSKELGIFATVGVSAAAWSVDGVVWNINTLTMVLSWRALAWSPQLGMFVALPASGTTYATSTDGRTWTTRTYSSTFNRTWSALIWVPQAGNFVALQSSSSSMSMTSVDGLNWTSRTITASGWSGLCYSPELSMVLGVSTSSGNNICTSSFAARIPTQTNVFDSEYNRLDNNGDWTIRGTSFTSPSAVVLGSTNSNTTIQCNSVGAGGTLSLLGGTGLLTDSAGPATVQYLSITVNGTPYKIALQSPN